MNTITAIAPPIFIDDRHRVLVVSATEHSATYHLQKRWNDAWETEFELEVHGCAHLSQFDHTISFHVCDPQDADALAAMIKAAMADALKRTAP